jgi:hypothetical protein
MRPRMPQRSLSGELGRVRVHHRADANANPIATPRLCLATSTPRFSASLHRLPAPATYFRAKPMPITKLILEEVFVTDR